MPASFLRSQVPRTAQQQINNLHSANGHAAVVRGSVDVFGAEGGRIGWIAHNWWLIQLAVQE
jgi:hypothetical protein